jgi:hypothetical protein
VSGWELVLGGGGVLIENVGPLQQLPTPVRPDEQDVGPTGPDPDDGGRPALSPLEEAG